MIRDWQFTIKISDFFFPVDLQQWQVNYKEELKIPDRQRKAGVVV